MRAIAEHGIPRIDLVAVSLYEFEKSGRKEGCVAGRADREYRYRRPHHDPGRGQELAGRGRDHFYRRLRRDHRRTARRQADRFQKKLIGGWPRRRSPPPRPTIGPSALAWPKFLPRASLCRPRSISARRARWRCATAKIRTSRPRCTRPAKAGSPEPSSFTARSFPTTTWWIWMRPGSWFSNSTSPPRRSSSTPIRAAARKVRRWPKAIAGHLKPIRSRRSAACWRSTARSMAKPPRRSPRRSSKRSLPRIFRVTRSIFLPRRRIFACCE